MTAIRALRVLALTLCAAGTLFWLYTFYGIYQMPVGDGTGMQWVAVMPLTLVFLFTVLPAFELGRSDRMRSVLIGVAVAALGVVMNATLWGPGAVGGATVAG